MRALLLVFLPWLLVSLAGSSSIRQEVPVYCTHGLSDCTVTNAFGSFTDGSICHAANAVYPRTEPELVAAVATAVAAKRKVKVATSHSQSIAKLMCPGGSDGTIISTALLNRTVSIDMSRQRITVEGGMLLRDLIHDAAAAGLSLPTSPYFYGVTVAGAIATGSQGSSLTGKGGALHEYVVGVRIVTPAAPEHKGFATVREFHAGDPDLDAVKVSLGVLGVISQVTLQLQPLFKRSVTFLKNDSDSDLAQMVTAWGRRHEFGDVRWLPGQGKVFYRQDDRAALSTPGDGLKAITGLNSASPSPPAETEEQLQEKASDKARCLAYGIPAVTSELQGFGFTNDGVFFEGYPVVGYQHRIQASGSCIFEAQDNAEPPLRTCSWDPRIRGTFMYNSGLSVAVSNVSAFIQDVQRLRDLNPGAFCGLDNYMGILLRYVRASSAYLGKSEDSVDFDITYYRSYDEGMPRAHADVIDELEQMALFKYGALPHWGKNRNFAFDGAVERRYPRAKEFFKVKGRYDPDGIFSSEWSDQVLGINGSPVIKRKGCAIQGICICSEHSDCAPQLGYFCSPGRVYKEARVCSPQIQDAHV